MIYWVCPKPQAPSGGVWFIHRLCWLLNDAGIQSRIFTPQPFQVWWDANPIPKELIVHHIKGKSGDTVVIPEVMWFSYADIPHESKYMFAQNTIWMDVNADFKNARTLVCSRNLANKIERNYHLPAYGKLTPYLDDAWFRERKESNTVVLFARRHDYTRMVCEKLKAAGFFVIVQHEPISQGDIAELLSGAEYYVHLAHPEGFPMACLEAMRSGCIVAGTTGGGGNEFMFHGETALVVQDPDQGITPEEFTTRIVEELSLAQANEVLKKRLVEQGYEWSLRYNAKATTQELMELFS